MTIHAGCTVQSPHTHQILRSVLKKKKVFPRFRVSSDYHVSLFLFKGKLYLKIWEYLLTLLPNFLSFFSSTHSSLDWGSQVLASCWLEASLTSLLHGHLLRAASFIKASMQKSEREQARLSSDFYSLMLEMTTCRFCHIILVRSKSLGPATDNEVRLQQGLEDPEARVTGGASLKLPTTLSPLLEEKAGTIMSCSLYCTSSAFRTMYRT